MTALEGHIVQLRGEMRDESSAVRGEMHVIADDLRAEMHALQRVTLEAIKAGDEETRRQMRVLFEEADRKSTRLNSSH